MNTNNTRRQPDHVDVTMRVARQFILRVAEIQDGQAARIEYLK